MKLVVVQPFAHKPGYYFNESMRIYEILKNYKVDIVFVFFQKVIDEKYLLSNEIRYEIANPRIFLRFLNPFLKKLEKNKVIKYLILFSETLLCLLKAVKISKNEKINNLFLNSGNIIALFLIARLFPNFNYFFRLEDFSRRMPLNLIRFIKRKLENNLAEIAKRRLERNAKKLVGICITPQEIMIYKKTGLNIDSVHIPPTFVDTSHNKIDKKIARQKISLDIEGPLFLVFGTDHEGKNNKIIFEAIKHIKGTIYVIFAGKMSSKYNNPEYLNKIYGYKNVFIHNQYIKEEDIPYYFSASDAIIISQIKGFHHSGNIFLSLQFQVPIIASRSEYIGDFVEKNGIGVTFEPENSYDLARAISEFLNFNENELKYIYTNLKKCAEEFSINSIGNMYIKLFN